MTRLRVLHVLDHSLPLHSGYSFRTAAILHEQRRLGMETVHLTSPKHYGSESDEEQFDGLSFFRTRPPRFFMRQLPLFDQGMIVLDTARRMGEIVKLERPNLIHAHSPALNGLAALSVARKAGLPLVYEMRASWEDAAVDHGTTRAGSARYRLSRALESYVLRHVDGVTTICEGLRNDILARGVPSDRITVIPNAVDVRNFRTDQTADPELRKAIPIGNGPVLGFIGSFYAYEGLDLLISALPEILKEHEHAEILLVGGGPAEPSLRQLVNSLRLEQRVHFVGRVPHSDVHRYYSLIDVLVYPRKSMRLTETVTPLKPLEAMAMGRIFIASDVGGHREVIPERLHSQLFPADDRIQLAKLSKILIHRRQDWRRLAECGRQYVENERTWQHTVKGYEEVYTKAALRVASKLHSESVPGRET